MTEYPKFTVNGVPLSDSQNMTLYVALQSFSSDCKQVNSLGKDKDGETIRKLYLTSIGSINSIIVITTK